MTAASPASVLLVDDNAAKRLSIKVMLAPLGHGIVEAESGREALAAVAEQDFAVILMNVNMPILDAYETATRIREERETLTPIIFVTAFGRDETETAGAYASGAVDFIFTPVLPDVLRAKVSTFVDLFVQAHALKRSLESITELNGALRDSERRVRAVLQNVADGIITSDADGLIESFNRSARKLFGYREEEVIGRPLALIVAGAPTDTPALGDETVGRRKDGTLFPMEMGVSQMRIGDRTLTIGCVRDISARRTYMEALERRSLHDELTELPNRTLFVDRVDRSTAAARRTGDSRAILVVDLDAFRAVNDEHGRKTADAVLKAVAERLRGAMRDADTVARLAGDRFGILPLGHTDVHAAEFLAWKVRRAFEDPVIAGGTAITVGASIGIAFFPQHGGDSAALLRRADLAMREGKRAGTGLGVFVAEPEDRTARRLTLLSELRDGIPRGELVLDYQPQVALDGGPHTTGVEALVRWKHPREGLLQPFAFMPDAERSDLIDPLTRWVLGEAIRQQRLWRDAGLWLTMAVNVSAHNLRRGSDLPATVAQLTAEHETAPGSLILELTEGALLDADVPDVLETLHTMGERLAIDDFGTGHSSLVYLQRLPIDEIKVDRSFVMNLATAPSDAVIARSTIDLAHNLGLTVVAEGVEDELALEMLVEYGCDMAQGYLFSRPQPAQELTRWLRTSPYGVRRAAALELVAGTSVHSVATSAQRSGGSAD